MSRSIRDGDALQCEPVLFTLENFSYRYARALERMLYRILAKSQGSSNCYGQCQADTVGLKNVVFWVVLGRNRRLQELKADHHFVHLSMDPLLIMRMQLQMR